MHCVHGPSPLPGLKLRVSQAVQTPVGKRSYPPAHAHCARPVSPACAVYVLGCGHSVHALLVPSWK